MKFTVEAKEFINTLNLLQSVIPTAGTGFTCALVLRKEVMWLYANNDSVTVRCRAKGILDSEGSGIAGIDISTFTKVLKGRDKVGFENKETVFKFKAVKGAYGGDIAILPVVKSTIEVYDDNLAKNEKVKLSSVDAETFGILRTALTSTNISVIHASDSLDTYITLSKGELEVVSSDNFHLAYCKVPVNTKSSFQLSPTKTVFDTLGKLADFYGGEAKIEFAAEVIKVFNADYSISVPTMQSSDTAFVRAKSFIDDLPKPCCQFNIDNGAVSAALDNILSIYEDGSLITVEFKNVKKGDVLEFSMKSTMGVISDRLDIDKYKGKAFKCEFDPRMFMDSLNLSKCTTASFAYISEKAIVLKCKRDTAELIYVNSVVSS